MTHVKYGIFIETGGRNCSANVPDLPGCIANGATVETTRKRVKLNRGSRRSPREAVAPHFI